MTCMQDRGCSRDWRERRTLRSRTVRNQTSNGVIFGKSEYTKALAYTGMSRQTASGYQALASIAAQAVVEPASRVSKRCARERNG